MLSIRFVGTFTDGGAGELRHGSLAHLLAIIQVNNGVLKTGLEHSSGSFISWLKNMAFHLLFHKVLLECIYFVFLENI